MKKGFLVSSLLLALGMSVCGSVAQAAPWVDASDIYLRADIQALADAGFITVPVNTYPLMWSGIGENLAKAEPSLMTPAQMDAFARVNFYYQNAINNRGNKSMKLAGATDAARFQHFGSDYREKGQLSGSTEYLGERFAFKAAATANYHPDDDKNLRLDGSYVAMILGNWVFTAGAIEQWWGPGFDTAMHKSTNARPMPSMMVSRNNANAFESPWLSWIGSWNLTAGVSVAEKERFAPRMLLWNMRASVKPVQQLEIGLSWTTQFCGEGQECDFDVALKSITGQRDCRADNSDIIGCSNYGNQMAGFDVRYGDIWFDVPVGIYLERTCEDSLGDPWQITDCGKMVGIDTRFNFPKQQYKLFAEYTDTLVYCGSDSNSFNCFYEHSTYLSGNRHYGRALGSTYDSDAKSYVLGLVGQFANSQGFTALLRYINLNDDGLNASTWAPQPLKEELTMAEVSYRLPMLKGMVTVGGTVSQSKFVTEKDDTNASIFGTYEYKF
ncbi:capsule assembly Wzi family protein [Shewanella sp.]|uniref:capsule assembly Wzi family protein n=1 Tax=Shewanella sp. TaxID=50422 RepID=UPI00405407B2